VSPRAPIAPPVLDGYEHVELLGSGGFADVFLYEQEFPRRRVAIKFLVGDTVGTEQRQRFTDEANAMASVSNHPFIVSIFRADVSPEGHPYLVMEYYPRPNFSRRARSERFQVADVLRVGVQIASAVETAHRIHILHRDIKPANILTSEYGRPGLTDFGIAAAEDRRADEADGMSIPWSPPEVVVGDIAGDERSDVYSLAATLHTLLTGRSPFEIPGGQNRAIDLIGRIQQLPVPAVDRPDVPGSLQRLLAQAMVKDPGGRPASAAALARELQAIEVEQRFSMTEFEVSDLTPNETVSTPIDADAGATRVRQPTVIDVQGAGSTTSIRPQQTFSRTFIRPPAGQRPSPGGAGTGPQSIIHQTPYVTPATSSGTTGKLHPRTAGVHDTGGPAAATYVAAQPTSLAIPERTRRSTWLAAGILAAVLIVALAGLAVLLLRDRGPAQVLADAEVAPVDTPDGERCRVRWSLGDDFQEGDTVLITAPGSADGPQSALAGIQEFDTTRPAGRSEFFLQAERNEQPVGEQIRAQGVC
jgi:serine/threonine protein kinase